LFVDGAGFRWDAEGALALRKSISARRKRGSGSRERMQEILQDWACQAQPLGRKIDSQLNPLNPYPRKLL